MKPVSNPPSSAGRLRLGVNIDHVATLRQARGTTYPSPVEAARLCLKAGADSITIHLREDRRHIQDHDLRALRAEPGVRLNLELALHPEIIGIALAVRPDEVCFVPERREERTTEGGLDAAAYETQLRSAVKAFAEQNIEVSLFIEAAPHQLETAARLGVPYVELHTGRFADLQGEARRAELEKLIAGARLGHRLGLRINAGHGLNLENLSELLEVPHLDTLNIGHSLVGRAVMVGMVRAVEEMREAMAAYRGGRP